MKYKYEKWTEIFQGSQIQIFISSIDLNYSSVHSMLISCVWWPETIDLMVWLVELTVQLAENVEP